MAAKAILYLMELVGVGGLLGLLGFITWTKMGLGAALSLLGAFFPELHVKNNEQGEGKIDAGKVSVVFRGGLRFVVVVAGLVLIVGSVLDGHEGFKEAQAKELDAKVNLYENLLTKIKPQDNEPDKNSQEEVRKIISILQSDLRNEKQELEPKKTLPK